jgi:hypothetical protein
MARTARVSVVTGPRLARDVTVQLPMEPLRTFNLPQPTDLVPLTDGLPEPPGGNHPDGTPFVWGRVDGAWAPVVPLRGTSMLGRLHLVGNPQVGREASDKDYVDTRSFDGGYYG